MAWGSTLIGIYIFPYNPFWATLYFYYLYGLDKIINITSGCSLHSPSESKADLCVPGTLLSWCQEASG